jgi:hypothetical protein
VETALVDPPRAARGDGDTSGSLHDERIQLLALLEVVDFGVVQAAERSNLSRREAVVVEQDRGSHERPGQASSPGFVGAGDEPAVQPAVEPEQPPCGGGLPPGTPLTRALGRSLSDVRGFRFAWAASR